MYVVHNSLVVSVAAHHPLAGRSNVVSPRLTILTGARALRQNLLTTMMMTLLLTPLN